MKGRVLIVALLVTITAQAQDIRKVSWGATAATVRAAENRLKPNREVGNFIQYTVRVGKYPAGLTYRFADGKLIRALYTIVAQHSEPQLYIDDFRDVSATLTAKYGPPMLAKPELQWLNPLFEGQTGKYGVAVASGHLVITQRWQTPTTLIVQSMRGDNFEIDHAVYYLSRRHPQPADEETAQGF